MQGQYQPRAPGIAAGQSNRTTTATYFDYQGIMRTAQPGELRPNFVYQNGIWVQNGWMREGASTNYYSPAGTPQTVDGIQGVIADTNQTQRTFNPSMAAPSTVPAVCSAYIKPLPGKSGNIGFWWGSNGGRPIVEIDPVDATLTGNSSYYQATISPLSDGWALFTAQFNSVTADGWFPPWFYSAGFYISIMLEYGTAPSSWMPYGQTRGAG